MSNYALKIVKHLGREVDFLKDVRLSEHKGITTIDEWNVEEAEPTLEDLDKIDVSTELAEIALIKSRQKGYATWQEQMDQQYHDQVDGTTTWKDAIAKVKSDNPKG
jgi:hypothetical protein